MAAYLVPQVMADAKLAGLPPTEILRIRQAQWCVVAVDDETRHRRGVWIVLKIMYTGNTRNEALDAVMSVRKAAQQIQNRQGDRRQRAIEHQGQAPPQPWPPPISAHCVEIAPTAGIPRR